MTQQSNSLPPLSLSRSEIVGEQAFEGDLLSRKKLAERLTGYLYRLKEGAVLAIDAQWGDGKTWFGRNWAKYLEDNGHKVVFIDAFEQDYIEDPFLLIAAEIAEALDNGNEGIQELREKAAGVMKAILPVGTKALINIAGRVFWGSGNASEEIKDAIEAASDTTADATSEWIKNKIQDHAQEKASLQHFRNGLEAVANAQEKPIVIFIDELDRCRPTFAVRLIERIKHFFDVPNVVFILLINRDQLEKAIKGVYGAETDAGAYLGKFVNFFFFLPKQQIDDSIDRNYVRSYVTHVLNRYNFNVTVIQIDNFRNCFTLIANHFNLSLRDIEKGIALYAFAQPIHKNLYDFLAYEITLKIAKPALFRRLLNGDIQAHKEAKELFASFKGDSWLLESISGLHEAHINNFAELGERFARNLQSVSRLNLQPENLFSFIARRIDLPMEI
jgi:hypothetical protein